MSSADRALRLTRRCYETTDEGHGRSTAVASAAIRWRGAEVVDFLEMFLGDDETRSIVMIGEIGGSAEEDTAQFLTDEDERRAAEARRSSFIAGRTTPPGRRSATPERSSLAAKATRRQIAAIEAAGITVSPRPSDWAETLSRGSSRSHERYRHWISGTRGRPHWRRPNWPVGELTGSNLGLDPTQATIEKVKQDGDEARRCGGASPDEMRRAAEDTSAR